MRKILIVIDMQNDFIDGAIGTAEAKAVVPSVVAKIKRYARKDIYATRDTHNGDYLKTQEGRFLPCEHCIEGTFGWQLQPEVATLIAPEHIFDKPAFGSLLLVEEMKKLAAKEQIALELIGLCTDICVVFNAFLLKAHLPEVPIFVDSKCCAGVTVQKHEAALEVMRSCQIQVL